MIGILALALASADPSLVALLQSARMTVPDAREITDLRVCPPNRNGDQWVALATPRKAMSYWRARWKDGRLQRLHDLQFGGSDEGLKMVAARAMERRMEACPWVSADQLAGAWAQIDGR
jgi:hypothetical protein